MENNNHTRALRDQLIKELVLGKHIRSRCIERAFTKVPRHLFLKGVEVAEAYKNKGIVTKFKRNIPVSSSSQPSLMADMLEALDVRKGMRVLEIGAGTGYNAALIAELTQNPKNVYSIDIDEDIVEKCLANLSRAGCSDIRVFSGDGGHGYPPAAPYDRIIVTCDVWDIPPAWMGQLKEGGVSVIPISFEEDRPSGMVPKFVKHEDFLISETVVVGFFMPMQGNFSFLESLERKSPIIVIDPVSHGVHPSAASFYIVCKDASPDAEAGIQSLFNSWERKGSMNFRSWQEECGFRLMMALESSNNLRASSKSSDYGFQGEGAGILDADAASASLVVGARGDIIVYGNDASMKQLSEVASRWEAMGRPRVTDFQLRVYPLDAHVALELDEWLIQKPSAKIVVAPALSP